MKKKRVLRLVIVLIALSVFLYCAYRLFLIFNDYRKTDEEYNRIRTEYIKPSSPNAASTDVNKAPVIDPKYEDAEPPLTPDWDSLRNVNPDVVGWIYVDATPEISYPIVWREDDNDYYLHTSFEGNYLYAGTIFLEGLNHPDFSDPLNIVYGHNMKNGSMFASLAKLLDQKVYDENPYFWILTPNGDYRYHIISVFQTESDSAAYQLFDNNKTFKKYEKMMQENSVVKNDVTLYDDDCGVLLSTCVSDHVHRTVVLGKCVSSNHPEKTTDEMPVKTVPLEGFEDEEESESEMTESRTSGFDLSNPFGLQNTD